MRTLTNLLFAGILSAIAITSSAFAQSFDSGSTGADGAFAPTCAPTPCTVAVALPPSGVFNFTTVTIAAGVTVSFTRNATNTPLMLLASGDVSIAGTIDVSGARGRDGASATDVVPNAGTGGPGGFDGGNGSNGIDALGDALGGAGLGPGGASGNCGGSFGGPGDACGNVIYGTPGLVPIIGGSGGGGTNTGFGATAPGGGGGGGAILIAVSGTVTLTGAIVSRGRDGGAGVAGAVGAGGGSGGAIRLVATTLAGVGGRFDVRGGNGGNGSAGGRAGGVGRIRIEAASNLAAINFNGVRPSLATPGSGSAGTLTITAVAGVPGPVIPSAMYATPDAVLPATTASPVTVTLAATNVPPGTTVTIAVIGRNGGSSTATTTLGGTLAASSASTSVAIRTVEPSVVMATTSFTVTAANGAALDADRASVERATVSATPLRLSQASYLASRGRNIEEPRR